jgi:hypothetical protein
MVTGLPSQSRIVLVGEYYSVYPRRLAVFVLHRDLTFAVRPQVGDGFISAGPREACFMM